MEFRQWVDLQENERLERSVLSPSKFCSFGISVLDDAMRCIFPDDLIVIGADSGAGKSTLALEIAAHNAEKGKTVGVFYLEGGHQEAIRRIKWRAICHEYFLNRSNYPHIEMDYILWCMNSPEVKDIKIIEDKISKSLNETLKNLYLYEITTSLEGGQKVGFDSIYSGLSDFFDGYVFGKIKYHIDLLIIDHLHYFDLDDGSRMTEADKLSKAMRMCKEITSIYKVPIILVSHFRKKMRDRGLPDQEDFHGSSNIPKISTDSIVIAPAYDLQDSANMIYPTFFRFAKSRRGLKANYAALVDFNLWNNKYSETYDLYPVSSIGAVVNKPLESFKIPKWAKNANNNKKKEVITADE